MMPRPSTLLLVGLVVLALAQIGVAGVRATRTPAPDPVRARPRFLTPGDTVGSIAVRDSTGAQQSVSFPASEGTYTVLLAFDVDCAHSDRVRAEWATWLQRNRKDVRILGVTRNGVDRARAYRNERDWHLPIVVPLDTSPNHPAQRLVQRTPWFFLVDAQGVLRMEGHGSDVARVDSFLTHSGGKP